jgi:hypothetical protein
MVTKRFKYQKALNAKTRICLQITEEATPPSFNCHSSRHLFKCRLFFILFYFLVLLGIELIASHLLGRHTVTWAILPVPFALVPDQPRPQSSYLYLPCSWNDRHLPLLPAYFLKWGLVNFFPCLALDQDPPHLCLPCNWDYRCEPPWPTLVWTFLKYQIYVYHTNCRV